MLFSAELFVSTQNENIFSFLNKYSPSIDFAELLSSMREKRTEQRSRKVLGKIVNFEPLISSDVTRVNNCYREALTRIFENRKSMEKSVKS